MPDVRRRSGVAFSVRDTITQIGSYVAADGV